MLEKRTPAFLLLCAAALLLLPAPLQAAWLLDRISGHNGVSIDGETPAVSDDGCYVAHSDGLRIFLHDCAIDNEILIDVGTQPDITPDGRYIAYATDVSHDGRDDNNRTDIYRYDRVNNAYQLVSIGHDGSANNGFFGANQPSISADGRFVAFASDATNITNEGLPPIIDHVYLRDLEQPVIVNERISRGLTAGGNNDSYGPAISRDGSKVAFRSRATDLTMDADTTGFFNVFLRNRNNAATYRLTNGNNDSSNPVISANGRFVAFSSLGTDLVPGDGNGWEDVFAIDTWKGATEMVSVTPAGLPGNAGSGCFSPSFIFQRCLGISASGRYISFPSDATDLVAADANGFIDVYLRDRRLAQTRTVSVDSFGEPSDNNSSASSLSSNGRFIAFDSFGWLAGIEINAPTNDVFLLDRGTDDGLDLLFPLVEKFPFAGQALDPDWSVVSGSWRLATGGTFVSGIKGKSIALYKELEVMPAEHPVGRIEAAVRMTKKVGVQGVPNASIVFARTGPTTYRFVKLLHGKLVIGQSGTLGGEPGGAWGTKAVHFEPGRTYRLTVNLKPDGMVEVFTGSRTVLRHKFAQRVDGPVGLMTAKAQSIVDNVVITDDSLWR